LRGKYTFSVRGMSITMGVIDHSDAEELLFWEKNERSFLEEVLSELKPDDVFWDIGANLGLYSLFAANSPGVNVVAFEPNPMTVKKINDNIALNKKSNIEVLKLALSDTKGLVKFDSMENRGNHGLAHIAFEKTSNTINVETNSGDKLIEDGAAPRPDIVKIDVEGAEYLVIKGMQNTLTDCRVLFCEVHRQIREYGQSEEELESMLKNLGFSLERIQERRDNTYHLKALRLFKELEITPTTKTR